MWLFTPDGFFSAVQHKDDPNRIMIRTRSRIHAQHLVDACPEGSKPPLVETPPPADYRYRVTVSREMWIYLVGKFAADISYVNYKNEASKRKHPSGFMSALHSIWSKLLGFQDSMHADSKKGRWGDYSTHHSHGGGSDPFGNLDGWLSRSGNASGNASIDDDDDEYVELCEGMIVQMLDDGDLGEGEVLSVDDERGTALVHFTYPLENGDIEEEVLKVPVQDLMVLYDPIEDQVEERLEAMEVLPSRPEVDKYTSIEDLADADDGSWPPPELTGFMRGSG